MTEKVGESKSSTTLANVRAKKLLSFSANANKEVDSGRNNNSSNILKNVDHEKQKQDCTTTSTNENKNFRRPLGPPRPFYCPPSNKETTILPTAFVSPQTVQITVQPPSFSSPPTPTTPTSASLTSLVAHYMTPTPAPPTVALNVAGNVSAAYLAACQQQSARRQSMFNGLGGNDDDVVVQRRLLVDNSRRRSLIGGPSITDKSAVSFRTDYSPTKDMYPNWQDTKYSADNGNFDTNNNLTKSLIIPNVNTKCYLSNPDMDTPVNMMSSISDERLNNLEERMRMLESRLSHNMAASTEEGNFNYCNNGFSQTGYSKSMRDLSRDQYPEDYLSQSTSFQNILTTSPHENNTNCDKVHYMSRKIRDLQKILEEERDYGGTRSSRPNTLDIVQKVKPRDQSNGCKLFYNGDGESSCTIKPSSSFDDILQENQSLQDVVQDLKQKLQTASNCSLAPDQYVTMQRYRLLKAKSKKLLQDKCEALRAAILEKESVQVRMQLQNKELSELRRQVYERDCQCKVSNTDGKSNKLREELLQLCKTNAQTSACLLGVCKDVANKKCPDYDQILGLKPIEDSLQKSLKNLTGSTTSLNSTTGMNLDYEIFLEHLVAYHKASLHNLNQMQRLMVDYYTNELVDSIDCRLQ